MTDKDATSMGGGLEIPRGTEELRLFIPGAQEVEGWLKIMMDVDRIDSHNLFPRV